MEEFKHQILTDMSNPTLLQLLQKGQSSSKRLKKTPGASHSGDRGKKASGVVMTGRECKGHWVWEESQ